MAAPVPPSPPRLAVITCAVLELEMRELARQVAAGNGHAPPHLEVLEQGLHNEPDRLRQTLQEAIDRVEASVGPQAIVLGYGLCSRGTEAVRTRQALLVVPRAHDCITLLLGSKERYARYVSEHPGTYWYSPGWNKCHTPPGQERHDKLRRQYVEKYGEDNADFLMEQEQAWFKAYSRATYVDLSIGVTDQDLQYTRGCADWLGWSFDHQRGDTQLMKDLLTGPWDDQRFLVLQPGQSLKMTADERVIEAAEPM